MLTLGKPPPGSDRVARESELIAEVDRLLAAGRAGEAVGMIGLSYLPSSRVANALAVCHLRLGNTARALNLLRHVATDGGALRADVPTVFKTNLATAHLVAGDVASCLRTLDEIADEDRPAVRRLRAAVARAIPRTAWGRWLRRLGIGPTRRPVIDGPIGELSGDARVPGGRDGLPAASAGVLGDAVPAPGDPVRVPRGVAPAGPFARCGLTNAEPGSSTT